MYISGRASFGANCTIGPGVTVRSGAVAEREIPGGATIGDNCFIGAGARIVGGVQIGNNVRISANCVVASNVPDNSVVMPQPLKATA